MNPPASGLEQIDQLIEDRDVARKRLEEAEGRLREAAAKIGSAIGSNVTAPTPSNASLTAASAFISTLRSGAQEKAAAKGTGTHRLSAAGREAIARAARKRWAAHRRAKKAAGK